MIDQKLFGKVHCFHSRTIKMGQNGQSDYRIRLTPLLSAKSGTQDAGKSKKKNLLWHGQYILKRTTIRVTKVPALRVFKRIEKLFC